MKDHRLRFYGLLFLLSGEFHWRTGAIKIGKPESEFSCRVEI